MTKMKHRKKNVLGLLLAAALGLMAFAASAQAITELGSGFFIGGAQAGALLATVNGKLIPETISTLLIPNLKLEINCKKFTVQKGAIESTTLVEGELTYEECTVLTNEKNEKGETKLEEAAGCELVVNHTGDNKHNIVAKGKVLPAELTDGTPAVLVEGTANVLTKEGIGCVLPKTTLIKGELCLKVGNKIVEEKVVTTNHTAEPIVEASEAIQKSCNPRLTLEGTEFSGGTVAELEKLEKEGKLVKDKLLFGINESFVDGKATVFATGAHELKTLGVLLI
jgi:hypothetical protein